MAGEPDKRRGGGTDGQGRFVMIRQAVIMAGGKGTRLTEITKDVIPKPMVPLLDKPLLEWQIDCLKRNGIDDIIMVIGHLGEVIRAYFGDGARCGVNIHYYVEEAPLGTAGALPQMTDMLAEEFVLLFGDLLLNVDFARFAAFHKQKQALVTLFVHPNAHPFDSDLIVADENCRVVRFDSKQNDRLKYWYANCVNAGLYIMDRKILKNIPKQTKVDLEKEVLNPLCEQNARIYAYTSPEYVKDVGTVERIRVAEQELASGFVAARNLRHRQKAIFLDRDGTLNKLKGLVYEPEQLELENCAVEALRLINRSGYLAILVTNQPVVARGLCSIGDVEEIHKKLQTLLGSQGVYLDAIEFCPHHPDKGYPEENPAYKIPCNCRKPGIAMLEKSAERFNIDLANSWVVGDSTVDVQTGKNAGCQTALIMTGEAGRDGKFVVEPDLTADNLLDAVKAILNDNIS